MKKVAILADRILRTEIEEKKWNDTIELCWAESVDRLIRMDADAYFDFSFEDSQSHITAIQQLKSQVFISETCLTAEEIDPKFIRVNCWPGMLSRKLLELAPGTGADIAAAKDLFNLLGWKYKMVPDIAGFISCRILATIINEAYYTLQDGVSSRNEIDTAMKLGTNYPYGPFEWAEKIGASNLLKLLNKMSTENSKYLPAESLLAQ
jgi:3-hydroxybutyryl-CoA dehydrogenase